MRLPDYEAQRARAFDEPLDRELLDTVLVCADALEQAGDPRGALITMEHALRDADPPRTRELREAMRVHALEHALFGPATPLLAEPRRIELEWRAGAIYGVAVDLRHVRGGAALAATIGQILEGAPLLRWLRVRTRDSRTARQVVSELSQRGSCASAVEWVELGPLLRPVRIAGIRWRSHSLAGHWPRLSCLVIDNELEPVALDETLRTERDDRDHVPQIARVPAPTDAAARVRLVRAICSATPLLRAAALLRIMALGPWATAVTYPLVRLLQQPGLVEQAPVIAALQAIGPQRDVMQRLAVIASRAEYDVATRKAAGRAAAAMQRALAVV